MANVDTAALREEWVGTEFDRTDFHVEQDKMLAWAAACGEVEGRFTDPSDPDFQACPTFTAQFSSRRTLPNQFPRIGGGRGFDGGKSVDVMAPVRAGDTLTGASTIADIFEKTGRSGTMVFIVHRMTYTNQRDEQVAVVDWKMIQPVRGGE